jgi:hypothetical protein
MNEAGCTGVQRAEWSREGRRLFARAELTCTSQPARAISGLSTITSDGTWLDVQATDNDGRANVRVRRYQRTAGQRRAGAAWTLEDVKEAASKISPAALEAALIESGARFRLNSRALVDLDAAKVPDSVIDLMVALSYPEKFQVERRGEASVDLYPPPFLDAASSAYWGYGLGYPYFSPYPGDYGNYRYYFSPFSYGYYGLYNPYAQYYPTSSIAVGSEPAPAQRSGDGRVIDGVGYTRVRPRQAQPADSDGGASSTASRGRATSSGYSQDGGSSSASSSSSSGSSSSGSGGGDGGGRTAQPR